MREPERGGRSSTRRSLTISSANETSEERLRDLRDLAPDAGWHAFVDALEPAFQAGYAEMIVPELSYLRRLWDGKPQAEAYIREAYGRRKLAEAITDMDTAMRVRWAELCEALGGEPCQ